MILRVRITLGMDPWKPNTPYRLYGAVLPNSFWSFICFWVLDPEIYHIENKCVTEFLDFLLKLIIEFFTVAFGNAVKDVASRALHNYSASSPVSFCTEIQALLLTSLTIVGWLCAHDRRHCGAAIYVNTLRTSASAVRCQQSSIARFSYTDFSCV
jgi:hypothetical protein